MQRLNALAPPALVAPAATGYTTPAPAALVRNNPPLAPPPPVLPVVEGSVAPAVPRELPYVSEPVLYERFKRQEPPYFEGTRNST